MDDNVSQIRDQLHKEVDVLQVEVVLTRWKDTWRVWPLNFEECTRKLPYFIVLGDGVPLKGIIGEISSNLCEYIGEHFWFKVEPLKEEQTEEFARELLMKKFGFLRLRKIEKVQKPVQ